MSKELISIVVPIYNVEEYLPRCVESIISQTYQNIEIMLVDDGSPDRAGAICDEYAARDSRIHVFHIPNGGVAKARQLGVENSTGEYIIFVDPDDWLPLDSVEVLYSHMSDDVSIVIGRYLISNDKPRNYDNKSQTVTNKEYTDLLIKKKIVPTPWGRIYRMSLFSSNSFPSLKRAEDYIMNYELSSRVKAVKLINNIVYNYFVRADSAMRLHKYSITELDHSLIAGVFKIYDNNNMGIAYKGSASILILTELFFQGSLAGLNMQMPYVQRLCEELENVKLSFKYRILKKSLCYPSLFSILMILKRVYVKYNSLKRR